MSNTVIDKWNEKTHRGSKQALINRPDQLRHIMAVAGVPEQTSGDIGVQADSIVAILYGEVSLVDDDAYKLGGRFYDNRSTTYSGSNHDWRLNHVIRRYRAQAIASTNMDRYETSGVLTRPLVTMHTACDPSYR